MSIGNTDRVTALPRLIVIAKAPVAGRSKTRLSPPCTPVQAAELAEASLVDTLDAVLATECGGRTLVLEGEPGEWLPDGFEVVPQVEGGLADRLAGAFVQVDGPALLIGMDTPQVDSGSLGSALAQLRSGGDEAVLGHCVDGGYWAIGMNGSYPGAFQDVPMSTDRTGELQQKRLEQLGITVGRLPVMRDIDFFEDARHVASGWPGGNFARAFRSMEESLCPS